MGYFPKAIEGIFCITADFSVKAHRELVEFSIIENRKYKWNVNDTCITAKWFFFMSYTRVCTYYLFCD